MFRPWMKLLPFFIVEWAAVKWCERQPCGDMTVVQPFGTRNLLAAYFGWVPKRHVRVTLIQVFSDEQGKDANDE